MENYEAQMEDEYIQEYVQEAEEAADSLLKKLKNSMSPQDFDEYIQEMKYTAQTEMEDRKGIESEVYSFDFDEDGLQVLVLEKHVDKIIRDIVHVTLKPYVFIYASDLENENLDSKDFHYFAFLEEIQENVKEKGFQDMVPHNLKELFKFLKTTKKDSKQNSAYPELELVFDHNEHKIYSTLFLEKRIFLEDSDFNYIEEDCKKINTHTVPKQVKPELKKFQIEPENAPEFE